MEGRIIIYRMIYLEMYFYRFSLRLLLSRVNITWLVKVRTMTVYCHVPLAIKFVRDENFNESNAIFPNNFRQFAENKQIKGTSIIVLMKKLPGRCKRFDQLSCLQQYNTNLTLHKKWGNFCHFLWNH